MHDGFHRLGRLAVFIIVYQWTFVVGLNFRWLFQTPNIIAACEETNCVGLKYCYSERGEESGLSRSPILRFAQNDKESI
jgi:hypothetical protein